MNHDRDYKTSYVEGPKGQLQETHLDSREMLNLVRDGFDIPMAKFFSAGTANTPPLSEQVSTAFAQNRDQYLAEGHVDALTLLGDVLPKAFRAAAEQGVFDPRLAQRIFDIAGSEGIDTAISYVFGAKPFDERTANEGGKLHEGNERFHNDKLTHPDTGEALYKVCPGFRVAQAIERQLVVGFRRILTDPEVADLDVTIPAGVSVGDRCKEVVNSLVE